MVTTSAELAYYLKADKIASGRQDVGWFNQAWITRIAFPDELLKFHIVLRKLEYLHNCERNAWVCVRKAFVYRQYLHLSRILGFTIPINVFGPGLSIAHPGTIVINTATRVGANCRIHVCVNIGTAAGTTHDAPKIGNNVYIGPGAKIYGGITIADGCAIGANAVVNKSFVEPGTTIAGVPARKVGKIDTSKLLIRATDILNQQLL